MGSAGGRAGMGSCGRSNASPFASPDSTAVRPWTRLTKCPLLMAAALMSPKEKLAEVKIWTNLSRMVGLA